MELLKRRDSNSLPLMQGVFHVDSKESNKTNQSGRFYIEQNDKQAILYIYQNQIEKDNYRLILKGTRLSLIISEKKQIEKPVYLHHIPNRAFDKTDYERLRSFEYVLPKNSYTINKSYWNQKMGRLEITLTDEK